MLLWKTWIPAEAGMTTFGFYLILIPKAKKYTVVGYSLNFSSIVSSSFAASTSLSNGFFSPIK